MDCHLFKFPVHLQYLLKGSSLTLWSHITISESLRHRTHQRYHSSTFACFGGRRILFRRVWSPDDHRGHPRKAATCMWVRQKASTTQYLLSWSQTTLRMCAETWATCLLHAKSQQSAISVRSWWRDSPAASAGEWYTANIILESQGAVWYAIVAVSVSFIHHMYIKCRQSVLGYVLLTASHQKA